jgi:mannose-6-phosphate isomerase-like protein (cupin superfamily)
MIVKRLEECEEITALDDTRVREFLNPLHDDKDLKLGYSLAIATIKSGHSSLPHRFHEASEVYYITKGKGVMHIDDETEEVGPGCTIYIPPKGVQYIENVGDVDLEFLCIVYPSWHPDAEELVE